MQTIGVLGVSGFVGSHVAALLSRRGYAVRGLLRHPDRDRGWIEDRVRSEAPVELVYADLTDRDSILAGLAGCDGAVMSAGVETQEPATVELMVGAANHTLDAAEAHGLDRVVFTSSTGSTNPPDGEPEIKREDAHWSDDAQQLAAGKFSPAAKTRMERTALERAASGPVRVAILNPSMIVGDSLSEEPSGVLRFLAAILEGERFGDSESIPDGSMSMIHVDDLAALHVAALEDDQARGRHFGVVQSWHWHDILEGLARVTPDYEAPAWPAGRPKARPTRFDTTKRDRLGVSLRGLDDMLADGVAAVRRRGLWG